MWQGQQPGGEQHPNQQQPNPYQQPPQYGQQQPYGQQPNPYQQPAGGWSAPTPPGGMQPPQKQGPKTSQIVAIVTVVAVLAAAVVVGVVLMNRDDGGKEPTAGGSKSPSPDKKKSASPSDTASEDDARSDGSNGGLKAVVPGWKPVSNPKHSTLLDVPPTWKIQGSGTLQGYGKGGFGEKFEGVTLSGPATYKDKWCESGEDSYGRALTGTKGANGAKNTKVGAENESIAWAAFRNFGSDGLKSAKKAVQAGNVKTDPAKAFTSTAGFKGHYVTSTTKNTPKDNKCEGNDTKSVAFTFKVKSGEFKTWILVTDINVKDEVPDATIKKIMKSLRPLS
ncbi:hypothetical protein [Streptomyces boninensis]|uniref:hypothetical protein n=1 Tax=Streptomyces boninensis TaxID=2039455 RepID=UPI003B224961